MRKTQFPIVKLVRKLRILSFLTQIPTFLRIVGNSAARGAGAGQGQGALVINGRYDRRAKSDTELHVGGK